MDGNGRENGWQRKRYLNVIVKMTTKYERKESKIALSSVNATVSVCVCVCERVARIGNVAKPNNPTTPFRQYRALRKTILYGHRKSCGMGDQAFLKTNPNIMSVA